MTGISSRKVSAPCSAKPDGLSVGKTRCAHFPPPAHRARLLFTIRKLAEESGDQEHDPFDLLNIIGALGVALGAHSGSALGVALGDGHSGSKTRAKGPFPDFCPRYSNLLNHLHTSNEARAGTSGGLFTPSKMGQVGADAGFQSSNSALHCT